MNSTGKLPVLAVVDVQNGFVSESSRRAVPVIADVVDRWQANGGDTVFTRYSNYPGSPFERLIGYFELHGSPETDLVPQLTRSAERAVTVIDKSVYTLFSETGSAAVDRHGWTDIYICGIDTECCVLKTAVDAFERGYTPWVLTDACASHSDEESHRAGLLILSKLIGPNQLITTSDMLEGLSMTGTEPVA